MKRLTERRNGLYYDIEECVVSNCSQKLGRYEDIEELCEKIVSQPIYEKYEDNGKIHKEDYTEYKALYNFKERRIELYGYEFINWFEVDNYGKTWALSEEELRNKELEKVGQMTYLQEVLIENMNEFCSEKFDLSYERTQEEANEYINKNIEEYRLLTTHNWY